VQANGQTLGPLAFEMQAAEFIHFIIRAQFSLSETIVLNSFLSPSVGRHLHETFNGFMHVAGDVRLQVWI